MNKKSIVVFLLRVFAVVILFMLSFMVGAFLSGISEGAPPDSALPVEKPPPGPSQIPILISMILPALVLGYFIHRSRWTGWKLTGSLFLAFYGSMTVVSQLESIVYLPAHLPEGMIARLYLMGAIAAGIFSPSAVFILGRMKGRDKPQTEKRTMEMGRREWAWKLAALALLYVFLYYVFGYYVAWQNPAVREYYGAEDPGGFWLQMAWIWTTTPWMFLFQLFRGFLWILLVLPAVMMIRGNALERGLAGGMLLAVWSFQLLMPNPFMPETVSQTHFVETLPCNFLFGFILGWLLDRRHASFRDIFTFRAAT